MPTKAGVWIDHTKAVVVLISDRGEEIKRIKSEIKKSPARAADRAPEELLHAQRLCGGGPAGRKRTAHLNTYYDEVIACIRDAEAILILGPGEAKGELKNGSRRRGPRSRGRPGNDRQNAGPSGRDDRS